MSKFKDVKINTKDVQDLLEFIAENKKWYWYLPFIGFFISTNKINEFARSKGILLEGPAVNDPSAHSGDYSYILSVNEINPPKKYSDGLKVTIGRILQIQFATFMISLFVMLILEILVFNFSFLLLKGMGKKTIKNNTWTING